MFQKDTQQALRSLIVLATEQRSIAVGELAKLSGTPAPTLAKVVATLGRHGLVQGRPGPGGGYTLAKSAMEISLHDVVVAFQGSEFVGACIFGQAGCQVKCSVHDPWHDMMNQLFDYLKKTHIGDVVRVGASNFEV
jgi:Rrf2 family transcriptional regulator, iron-sulfur cluster assembly transcription factor